MLRGLHYRSSSSMELRLVSYLSRILADLFDLFDPNAVIPRTALTHILQKASQATATWLMR